MWSITKILVPTDFSPGSEAALDAAVDLARRFQASMVLMHALQVPAYTLPPTALLTLDELARHVEDVARKALAASAARIPVEIPVTTVLRVGSPFDQILQSARDEDASLIVMGSRSLRGLPRALLGSTAERIVRYTDVPVLIFHAAASPRTNDVLISAGLSLGK